MENYGLAPGSNNEAALVTTLEPDSYSAVVAARTSTSQISPQRPCQLWRGCGQQEDLRSLLGSASDKHPNGLANSFILFATWRLVYQSDALKPLLGYFAGLLLLMYITFESPLSGMSLNPARSVASAIPARSWKAIWIYFVAPPLAMLLAAALCG